MKKLTICWFLILVLICLAACTAKKGTVTPSFVSGLTPNQALDTPLDNTNPPLKILPPPYHATIEYGEPDLLTDNTGPLWTYIRFPLTGDVTDEIIVDWVISVHQNALAEITALCQDDPAAEGEINIQFDSYFVENRFAGVLENGMFMTSHLAHPLDIIRTFNIDTKNEVLLGNADILDYARLDSILALLREEIAAKNPATADLLATMVLDESWLTHITIGHDGIIVVLERGMYFPAYVGALKVTLPYHKLGPAYILGAAPAPSPAAEPADIPASDPPAEPTDIPAGDPPAEPTDIPADDSPAAPPPATPTELPAAPPIKPAIPNVPPQSNDIDPSKPLVALTFDDGPSKYTLQILDILARYGARATFCVIGNLVEARKDTIKHAFDLGNEIIGHSWDHRDLSKLTAAEITNQLNDTAFAIEAVTGVYPLLYRPPYGATSATLNSVSGELGYALINWSVDTMDWSSRNADKVYDAVISDVGNRAIILCHDLYGSTADAMERVIPELLSKGYQLVTVSELMYYADKTLEAGVVYYSGK